MTFEINSRSIFGYEAIMNVEERIISILRQKAENSMPSILHYNLEEEEIKKLLRCILRWLGNDVFS